MNVYVNYLRKAFLSLIFLTWKKVQVPIGSPKFDGLVDNLGQFKKRKQGPRKVWKSGSACCNLVGIICPPPGVTDLPKSAMPLPAPPALKGLVPLDAIPKN